MIKSTLTDAFFVKDGSRFHKVYYNDILYFENDHVYVTIITKSKKNLLVRSSLSQLLENLNPAFFCRISRSNVVNVQYIDGFCSWYLLLQGHKLLIGKNYQHELFSSINIAKSYGFRVRPFRPEIELEAKDL